VGVPFVANVGVPFVLANVGVPFVPHSADGMKALLPDGGIAMGIRAGEVDHETAILPVLLVKTS
jgi:hypothetical protein